MNPDHGDMTTPVGAEPDAVEILDDENGHLHDDPRIPSRAELDALYEQGEARGWDEYSARAWEYLDGRREIADERAAAVGRGDTETVARLDRQHAMMDQNYIGLARSERRSDAPVDGMPGDGMRGDAERSAGRSVFVAQDPDWERPSVPDDPARLRARIAALRARRGAEHDDIGESAGASQARRAQLAAWADDDGRHDVGFPSADGRGSGDEDGA